MLIKTQISATIVLNQQDDFLQLYRQNLRRYEFVLLHAALRKSSVNQQQHSLLGQWCINEKYHVNMTANIIKKEYIGRVE